VTTILIVDDDASIRKFLKHCLENLSYHIIEAANGKEAVAMMSLQHPKLVITDIIMPEKEGFDTIFELRRIDPDLKIIAMSGGGMAHSEAYLNIAKELGAHYTIEKPIERKALIEAIVALLSDSGENATEVKEE
jgi:CheY-like chemotaxis protein